MDLIRNKKIKITRSTLNNKPNSKRLYSTVATSNLEVGSGIGISSGTFKKENNRNLIKPINKSNVNQIANNFVTMDIETIKLDNGNQQPISITMSLKKKY